MINSLAILTATLLLCRTRYSMNQRRHFLAIVIIIIIIVTLIPLHQHHIEIVSNFLIWNVWKKRQCQACWITFNRQKFLFIYSSSFTWRWLLFIYLFVSLSFRDPLNICITSSGSSAHTRKYCAKSIEQLNCRGSRSGHHKWSGNHSELVYWITRWICITHSSVDSKMMMMLLRTHKSHFRWNQLEKWIYLLVIIRFSELESGTQKSI